MSLNSPSVWPEIGEITQSSYEHVAYLNPDIFGKMREYNLHSSWHVCDAFTVVGEQFIPNNEVLNYQESRGWDLLPPDRVFISAYHKLRALIIEDAVRVFGTRVFGTNELAAMIQLINSGPSPLNIHDYDKVPHLDAVSLLDQRVLIYFCNDPNTTRVFTGNFAFKGFIDDYSQEAGFAEMTEVQPKSGELVRGEGITLLHAADEPIPNRIFVRAFVEENIN